MGRKVKPEVRPAPEDVLSTSRDMDERMKAMAAVAGEFEEGGWRPAPQVLKKVESVPTIFPFYDYGTRVGGHPLARVTTVHGPSGNGKSYFALGLLLSFLQKGHFAALIDAEMTTPITWCERIMQRFALHPTFSAMRPDSYESAVDAVRTWCEKIGNAREQGRIPGDATGILVVDSVRKLVPRRLTEKLLKEGSESKKGGGIDGMGGRAAQYKAALNAAWLDELVPLLNKTNTTAVLIGRETEDPNADANDRMYGNDWKLTGGKSLIYEASLIARITRASWNCRGSGDDKKVVGERHQVRIYKSKVEGKDGKHIDCFFNTSNGTMTPEGFDTVRDLLDLALRFGMVNQKGAWLEWVPPSERSGRKYNGESQFIQQVSESPELTYELDQQVRSGFATEPEPVEDAELGK
jgi:RecA/RadA recombinase